MIDKKAPGSGGFFQMKGVPMDQLTRRHVQTLWDYMHMDLSLIHI